MIDPDSHRRLKAEIRRQIEADRVLLDRLRDEIRPLRGEVRPIQPRVGTTISLVGTDGGDNRLRFDPFLVQIVRVVDSSNNELCLEVVTPTTRVQELAERQFGPDGRPVTALGAMMAYLEARTLPQLSRLIRSNEEGRPVSATWVRVYRELVEWAVLFQILRTRDFATDTLLVFDGLLRSTAFRDDLFHRLMRGMEEAIADQERRSRRKIYLVGLAKSSQVLIRYRLAMALEGILAADYPAYVEIPRSLEERAYVWAEYLRGIDQEDEAPESDRLAGGKMFLVKFGRGRRDPIWPVDLFIPHALRGLAPVVLGHLQADAVHGFPVPLYPLCLQRAHQHAALADFDFTILQDQIFAGIREILGQQSDVLDVFRIQDLDPARQRYD